LLQVHRGKFLKNHDHQTQYYQAMQVEPGIQ